MRIEISCVKPLKKVESCVSSWQIQLDLRMKYIRFGYFAFLLFSIFSLFCFTPSVVGAQGNAARGESTYRLLRLADLPTPAAREALAKQGVELLEHVEGTAYWARISPQAIRRMRVHVNPQGDSVFTFGRKTRGGAKPLELLGGNEALSRKLSSGVFTGRIPAYAAAGKGRAKVMVRYRRGIPAAQLEALLRENGVVVVDRSELFRYIAGEMPLARMRELAKSPYIASVRFQSPKPELFNVEGRILSGSEQLGVDNDQGLGYGLQGEGVTVTILDGDVIPHLELAKSRLITLQAESPRDHGEHVAGTVAASGAFDARARGMAPRAKLVTANFDSYSYELAELMRRSHKDYGSVLSQNSYGIYIRKQGVFDFCYNRTSQNYIVYTPELDRFALESPTFGLIYAAGNDQHSCGASLAQRYQTSSRMEKNIITVAAVDSVGEITEFSSWGPLMDGRMVPLVSANGYHVYSTVYGNQYRTMNGTSMACPGVSGLTALLYELYRKYNGGSNPNFVLIKSILLNTACEAGHYGPDYQYGYGIADGVRASRAIVNRTYREDRVANGEERVFKVDVPAGTHKAKFMLVWHDAPGFQYAKGVNLKDDLDMEVIGPNGVTLPWCLNPNKPHDLATRAPEHVNNHEQVQIDRPVAGTYTVVVRGGRVTSAAVDYALSWDFVAAQPSLRYPNGGELLSSGRVHAIRWYARGATGEGDLELSTDGGESYAPLAHVLDVAKGYTLVDFPATLPNTSKARIRLTVANTFAISAGNFTIASFISGLQFVSDPCQSGGDLTWNPVEGAMAYDLMRYDEESGEIRSVREVREATAHLKDTKDQGYYSVRVKVAEGIYGEHCRPVRAELVKQRALGLPLVINPLTQEGEISWSYGSEVHPTVYQGLFTVQGGVTTEWAYNRFSSSAKDFVGLQTNQRFVALGQTCVDARNITDGELKVKVPVTTIMKNRALRQAATRMIVRAEGASKWRPLEDVLGHRTSTSSGSRTYDLRKYQGTKFALGLQLLAVLPSDGVQIGKITFDNGKSSDVAVGSLSVPASGHLTNREKIQFLVFNHTHERQTIPVVIYVNGQEVIRKTFSLKGKESSRQTESLDLSKENTCYRIRVVTDYAGDTNANNNVVEGRVYNHSPFYLMPMTARLAHQTKEVEGRLLFADDGGQQLDYSREFNGTVQFTVPAGEKQKKVKMVIKELALGAGAHLRVLRGAAAGQAVELADFSAQTLREPVTLMGTREAGGDGSLTVQFISTDRETAAGWIAELSLVDEDDTTPVKEGAIVGLLGVSVSDLLEELPLKDTHIRLMLENRSGEPVKNVEVYYEVDGQKPLKAVIAEVEPGRKSYELPQAVDLKAHPMEHTIAVRIGADDGLLEGRYKKISVWSDRYIVTRFKSSPRPLCQLKSIAVGGRNTPVLTGQVEYPNYLRQPPIAVYTDTDKQLELTVVNDAEEKARVYVWIDSKPTYRYDASNFIALANAELPVNPGHGEVLIVIPVPTAGLPAGTHNMRVAVSTDLNLDMQAADHAGAIGEVYDFTLDVAASRPEVVRFAVADLQLTSQPSGATPVEVQVHNQGTVPISPKWKLFVNDVEVNQGTANAIPNGAAQRVQLGTVDMAARGEYRIAVRMYDPVDDTPYDNSCLISACNRSQPVGGSSYTLAFAGGSSVLKTEGWNDKLETATYEAWVKPARYDASLSIPFSRLFDGKGANIFLTTYTDSYGFGDIVVYMQATPYSTWRHQVIPLHVWSHVAVVIDNGVPKLYINGESVPLRKGRSGIPEKLEPTSPLYIGNSDGGDRAYVGEMDQVRVWNTVRSEEQIKENMYAVCPEQPSLLLQLGFEGGRYVRELEYKGISCKLLHMDSDSEDNCWKAEPTPVFSSLSKGDYEHEWKILGNTAYNSKRGSLSDCKLEWKVNMPEVVATIGGKQYQGRVEDGLNLSSPVEVKLTAPWVGHEAKGTMTINVSSNLSDQCELESFSALSPAGVEVNRVGNSFALAFPAGVSRSAVSVSFKISEGAHMFFAGRELHEGDVLSMEENLKVDVVAENFFDTKSYYIICRSQQAGAGAASATRLHIAPSKHGRVQVLRNGIILSEGAKLIGSERLLINAQPDAHCALRQLEVKGAKDVGGGRYEVDASAMEVEVSAIFERVGGADTRTYQVSYNQEGKGKIAVFADGQPINSGIEVDEGARLLVKLEAAEGAETSLIVNGQTVKLEQNAYEIASVREPYAIKAVFVVGKPNAVRESSSESLRYRLYPNPVRDYIRIEGLRKREPVRVYSLTGVLVQVGSVEPSVSFDARSLPRGSYILRVDGKSLYFVKE